MKILTKGNYYGAKKQAYTIDGIILSEYDYNIPKTDWHFHENPYLMYLLKGDLYDVNKRQKTLCPSGSLLLHNWQEPHFNTKESDYARGFHIEFERSWFTNKQLDIDLWEGSKRLENPKSHHLLAQLYAEFKTHDAYSKVSIELLLLQLCEGISFDQVPKKHIEPSWLPRLKMLLNDSHETVSLRYLSNQLGVHPVHISRAVPKYLSTTLGDYLRQQKIKKALGFLLGTNLSLLDITYSCGFSDQSHFIRTFKRYMDCTPQQYKKRVQA